MAGDPIPEVERAERPGRVVLLNGPSSAGKTSIATALVELLPTPWLNVPVDLLHAVRSRPDLAQPPAPGDAMGPDDWQQVFRRTRAGYHRVLAGLAAAGNDVVGDHVLSEPWRIADLLNVLDGTPALLVHVTAPLEELERRERARGDREVGAARLQYEAVFAHGDCDLLLDTSGLTARQAAARVRDLIEAWPQGTAFDRLRAAR